MALKGLDNVLKNMNAAIQKIEAAGVAGLIKAGVKVRNQGQKETPLEFGKLEQSWYGPDQKQGSYGPVVEIGLTASYAPFVHEMVGANFTGPRPDSKSPARQQAGKPTAKAKFLEDPLKDNEKSVLNIIASNVRRAVK